jgi:ABC-type ATPase involved in cell division
LKLKVQECRKNLTSTEKNLSQARKRASLQSTLDSLLVSGQSSLDLSPEEVETELDQLSSSVSKLERRLPKCELRQKLEAQLKELPESEGDEESLSTKHQKWRKKLKDTQATLSATQSELNKLSGVGDVCYTCQRSISSEEKEEMVSDRAKALSKLKKALTKAQEAADYYSDNLESLQARAELLLKLEGLPSGDAAELRANILSLRQRMTVLHKSSAHIAKLQSIRDQIADLPDLCGHLEDMESNILALTSELDIVDSAHRWLLQHGTAEYDAQSAQRTQGMLTNTEAKMDECSSRLVEIQEKLARYKGLKRQKSDLNKTLNKTSVEKQRHRVLKYLTVTLGELKKDGLRESTTLLSKVLPLYLNQLFPEGDIQLAVTDDADGFDLMFNKGGYPIPLTQISGGQAKRVGLAIIFSFAKMGRNTTNLLICDEPFRDLDQRGRESCFEVLKDFDMGTILVTSHDIDMQASKKYDQVWTVRMKNHQSRLYLD